MTPPALATLLPKARPRPRGVQLLAPLFRSLYAWRARLFHPVGAARTVHERLLGMALAIHPGVLNPAGVLTSPVLLDAINTLPKPTGQRWLDLGTGCGLAALHAARRGAQVVATDLDSAAVACAHENTHRLGLTAQIEIRDGDLFAPVPGERFDVILFHPPYFPGPQDAGHGPAWHYGDLPARFAAGLAAHLAPSGVALLLLSTNGDCAAYLEALGKAGFKIDLVLEREFIVERAIVYRVRMGPVHG